jgi:uncharacterized protein YneF (UPF0154 family)
MDFKDYVSGKQNQGHNQQAGPNFGNMPIGNLEDQVKQVQGMSKDDMMSELRRAKQSGSLNENSLRGFLDSMGANLTEQQRRNILNLVNNL